MVDEAENNHNKLTNHNFLKGKLDAANAIRLSLDQSLTFCSPRISTSHWLRGRNLPGAKRRIQHINTRHTHTLNAVKRCGLFFLSSTAYIKFSAYLLQQDSTVLLVTPCSQAVCNARMRTAEILDASAYLTKQHALRAPNLDCREALNVQGSKWQIFLLEFALAVHSCSVGKFVLRLCHERHSFLINHEDSLWFYSCW